MRLGVLLEKKALIDIAESVLSGLSTRKSIFTEVFETVRLLRVGNSTSSGSAEVKSQSSSAKVPLVAC